METIQILVLDDHALFREAVAVSLSGHADMEVIAQAGTVEAGLAVIKAKRVDLVLLDLDLGAQKGGEFLTLARSIGFRGKVLVVTAGVGRQESADLLQNGCAGIFLKHERPQVLIQKIREIMVASECGDTKAHDATEEHAEVINSQLRRPLTQRERQVFRGVFAGLSNKEIASEMNISETMAKAFVQQLFRKTRVHSRAQLVRVAIELYWNEIAEG